MIPTEVSSVIVSVLLYYKKRKYLRLPTKILAITNKVWCWICCLVENLFILLVLDVRWGENYVS